MKGQNRTARWRKLVGRRWLPYALLALGGAVTVGAARQVALEADAAVSAKFEADAIHTRRQIETRLNVHFDTVRAGAALLSASNEISATDFRGFVAGLKLAERYPGMKGIGFAERVSRRRLPSFLRLARLDGLGSLRVWPPGTRSEYYPVLFLEPSAPSNRTLVGFDLGTDPEIALAMAVATDTGQPVASAKRIGTPPFGASEFGFVLVAPIYPVRTRLKTVAERRRELVGFVFSPFMSEKLLQPSVELTSPGIAFDVYDGSTPDEIALLKDGGTSPDTRTRLSAETISVAGREWMVAVQAIGSHPSLWAKLDAEVVLAGWLLSVVLFVVTRAQVRDLETITRHEGELRALAQRDALTQLPNRSLMGEHLAKAIAAAHRNKTHVAVLFLDLDRFKHINDSLGHSVGDELLLSVAARLQGCVRGADTVSRLGGDEFVVVLSDLTLGDHAAHRAQQMIDVISAQHDVAGHPIHVSVSVGISIYPDDGRDAPMLLQAADTAMYQAKEHGRNGYQFFRPEMNERVVRRQRMEVGLRRGLDDAEFVLHYQPKIALATGAITGVEALLRWPAKDGAVDPSEFVPVAEDSGLIVPIGRWVLREACRQARTWYELGVPTPVAVNISAIELRDKDFLQHVRNVLGETGLDARYLEIELTESSLMESVQSSLSILDSLKKLGVRIALDDFGTGYSGLSYLRRFPIDVLKIDQSFVQEIHGRFDGRPIVSAIISMGKSLGCRVIAEGVETEEQLAFLKTSQCSEGQGFYFGRPVAAAELSPRLH